MLQITVLQRRFGGGQLLSFLPQMTTSCVDLASLLNAIMIDIEQAMNVLESDQYEK